MDNNNYYDIEDSKKGWYGKTVIVLTVCLALLGIYTIYSAFTTDIEWGFKINWNCFKSPFFPVLAVIGFFLQFFNWQHMSMESWIGRKGPNDSDYKWEKNNDIVDSMFAGCLMPILGHLIFIPCLYGAIMWYAIMGLVHVLGKLSPFFITALVAALIFFYYRWTLGFSNHKYRIAMLVALTALVGVIFGGAAYYMKNPKITTSSVDSPGLTSIGACTITGNGVNLRHGPGTEYEKVGITVSSGESYPLLEYNGEWVKINHNGTVAWISSKFCQLTYSDQYGMEEDDPGCAEEDWEEPMITESPLTSVNESQQESQTEQMVTESGTLVTAEVASPISQVEEPEEKQLVSVSEHDDNSVYESVDRMAEFPGGMPALMRWLSSNVQYPEAAQKNDVQGRVVVKFIVEKDGSITNAQVIKSVAPDLDQEALRVVRTLPKWIPGKNDGNPVRSYFSLPVNFRLQEQ